MSWLKRQEVQEKIVLFGLFVLLGIVLALMFMMGRYSFRQVDDYSFAKVEDIWLSTHSVLKTCVEEWNRVVWNWKNWQGLYSGDWLYFVLLAIFGRKGYFITIYISVLPLVFAQLYLGRTLFGSILKASRVQSYLVALPVILLQLMFPPSAAEGFYWMCAAVHYTLALALELWLVAFLLKLIFVQKESGRGALRIGIFLFGFLLGGFNYVSAISLVCIYGLFVIYLWWKKHAERIFLTAGYLWFLAWFLISALSPGNSLRQASAGEGMGAVGAILMSFVEAWKYLTDWWIWPVTLTMLALLPVMMRIAARKAYSYPLPILFTVLSFCVYASQFTPCLYALGMIGAYRVQNLYRFTLYILLVANEYYWVGYVSRLWEHGRSIEQITARIPMKTLLWAMAAVLVIAPTMLFRYGDTVTAMSAYRSLRSGQAARFYQEHLERVKVLEGEGADIVLEPFSAPPYLLFFGDIQEEPTSWENMAYAEYYGKNSVRLRGAEIPE